MNPRLSNISANVGRLLASLPASSGRGKDTIASCVAQAIAIEDAVEAAEKARYTPKEV